MCGPEQTGQGEYRALRYKGVVYGQYRRSREGRGLIDTGIGKVSDLDTLTFLENID